jgi:phosphatidylserine/phosphatidylglycerophosphate/cardiolipin synthase-like enzyme
MFISYTQKETNQIIYNEIKKSSKYIHITTMFFNDKDLSLNFIELLNHKVKEHPDIEIRINIGLNPFDKPNINKYNLNKKIHLRFIPMRMINTYHIRLFSTESIFAVGGIDIRKLNLINTYIQFTLFIPIQNNVFISKTISNKNFLYDFTENKNSYNISKVDPYTKVNELIDNSKQHIFIDNQYFFSNTFTNKLIEKKKNNPNIKIEVFSNDKFENNVFNNQQRKVMSIILNIFNKNNMKKLKNENIIAKTPIESKYTHNKLFIFDKKYILVGSMNIMNKSLQTYGGDIEMCVLIKNKNLANEMLDYYKNNLF